MTYSPFPEFELEALARECDEDAKRFAEGSQFRAHYTARAAMLRNAIVCHEAVRERALMGELKLSQLPGVL